MAFQYSPSIDRKNLVTFLDPANLSKYTNDGSNWNSWFPKNQQIVGVNTPTYNSGTNKGTWELDGDGSSGSYFDNLEDVGLDDNFWVNNWSFGIWVRFDTLSTSAFGSPDKPIIHHGRPSGDQGLHLCQRNTRVHFGLYGNDSQTVDPIETNKWYNIVWTLDNLVTNNKQIFVNGEKKALNIINPEDTYAPVGTFNNTTLGEHLLFGSNRFDGDIGLFWAYNVVLHPNVIEKNYEAFRGRYQ